MPTDWERVTADPALLADVRARYTGPGDVADQLWWLDHPGEPTRNGAPDPASALEHGRRALYRPGGAAADAEVLRRDEAALEAARDAARRALRTALAATTRPPAQTAALPGRGVARRTLAGAAIAALLVGAAAGFAGGRFTAAGTTPAFAVFDGRQQADDRPPASAPLPSDAVRSSLRHLATSSTTGAALYAARSRGGDVCLIAVVRATEFRSTCTTRAGFALAGLSMTFAVAVDPTDDSGVIRDREISPTWTPSGDVRF